MNGCIGVHGCGSRGVKRPTMLGTDFACVVGSTVLTAVGKLTVWASASAAVKVLTRKMLCLQLTRFKLSSVGNKMTIINCLYQFLYSVVLLNTHHLLL